MKNTLKNIISLLACAAAVCSCETQTTPEPVRVQDPFKQAPIVRDAAYFARLRAYKQTEHPLAFGWFGSWTAINASEQSRMRSTPDSMDIISLWSQWHSLTPAQIEDKAFVQQVLGTKVVFCISAKDVPEEFKVDGQITDESLVAYAKAWGKDSMDKYQYDGIDIDFETAADHLGPLNTTPGLFKKFCEQLSQYIGPKSGTGRLFLIDGNIDRLDMGIAELCDYAVSQAYNCGSAGNLQSRTSNAEAVGWTADRIIFTENFESLWKNGGVNHTTLSGESMPSLLGMADFAVNGTSCGFGSYHMEYEYGHADMPYKYLRQAIQLANPAPRGDYTKNLLSLNEAGETAHQIALYPSGLTEELRIPFTAVVTGVPAAEANIPLMVDNSLVSKYNDYYYTEYKTVDPSIVSFSGPLHFAQGEQETAEPAYVIISDVSSFVDGEEYLVPIRADFSKNKSFSANLDKEVRYLKLKTVDAIVEIGIPDGGSLTEVKTCALPDGTITEEGTYSLRVMLTPTAPADADFPVVFDPSLVAAYNEAHGTSYAAIAKSDVTVPSTIGLKKASSSIDPVEIKAVDPSRLTAAGAMAAIRIDLGGNPDYRASGESSLVKYLLFKKSVTNVEEGATSVDGVVIEDRTGWVYSVEGEGTGAIGGLNNDEMFDGIQTGQLGWYTSLSGRRMVTVDMAATHTVIGWRMGLILGDKGYTTRRLYDVKTSVDGIVWEDQFVGGFDVGAPDSDLWQYVKFYAPVQCRYIRFTYSNDSSSASGNFCGSNEFNAIAPR